jgi:NADPH-dependent curcumin reductase CurA
MEPHPGGFTYIPILETEEPVHARAISVVLKSEREGVKEGEIIWLVVVWEPFTA